MQLTIPVVAIVTALLVWFDRVRDRRAAYRQLQLDRGLMLVLWLLSPFEICFAFLYECPHTFTHILSGEQQEEVLALHLQALFQ